MKLSQPTTQPRVARFLITVLCAGLCWVVRAQETNVLSMASPQLNRLLSENPTAFRALTNVLHLACGDRTLWLYYFYSTSQSPASAFHDYPSESHVAIYLREDQEPLDQYICLMYEAQNSTNQKRFAELLDRAKAGSIAREQFAHDIAMLEFDAVKKTRDRLKEIRVRRGDLKRSSYHKIFAGVPDDFDRYLFYATNRSPARNIIGELEGKYDLLRKPDVH